MADAEDTTFINRTTTDYGLTSDQPAVNAHIARVSHRRRKRARAPYTARRTFASRFLAMHQIGGHRDDPFWSLPVANKYDAMTGFDHRKPTNLMTRNWRLVFTLTLRLLTLENVF